jgi:hypothetical protein
VNNPMKPGLSRLADTFTKVSMSFVRSSEKSNMASLIFELLSIQSPKI